ncbi:MAG: hypothetical protein ABUL64_04540, partial [Singulisphaera sp.]
TSLRTGATNRIDTACRRMKASWSNTEKNRRQSIACRRQQSLWQLLASGRPEPVVESEILAIGAPSLADLARFAG